MGKINFSENTMKKIYKGRAAWLIAVAASAFLCILTLFEFTALKMEWDIPALKYITGGAGSYIFEEYREGEMSLDASAENELLISDSSDDSNAIEGASDVQNTNNAGNANNALNDTEDENTSENITGSENENPNSVENVSNLENSNSGQNINKDTETDTNTGDHQESEEKDSDEEEAEEIEFPYYLKVNRQQNVITVYEQDENGEYTVPTKAILCSTGLYNATPLGTFHLSDKYIWRELHGGVYGQYASRITGGVLFHSVPYRSKSKNSLYADKYNKLGQQASMGCIRLNVEDAKWICENCPSGTTVEIYDDADNPGPLGKPEGIKIDLDNPNKGWDPTDPDENNPWNEFSKDM